MVVGFSLLMNLTLSSMLIHSDTSPSPDLGQACLKNMPTDVVVRRCDEFAAGSGSDSLLL